MLGVAREFLGVEWAHAHRKDKKATLATAMETAFAKSDSPPLGVTKEGHAAALAWAPPGFRAFDTGTVDDEDAAPPEAESPPADQPSQDTAPADEAQSGTQQEAPARQPDPAAEAGDAEQPATSEPSNGAPDPATTESPGVPDSEVVAPTGHEAIDAMNAVPVAGGGPRVIVSTVGFENGGDGDASPDAQPPAPPVPGNGHDTAGVSGGDGLEIPAFLRRS